MSITTAMAVIAICTLGLLRNGFVVWLVATAVFTGASFFIWYGNDRAIRMTSTEWLKGVLASIVIGVIFFAIDGFTASFGGHYDSFFQAALHAGSPLGIVLTIATCPAGTILFIGGWVRAELIERLRQEPTGDS